MHLCISFNRIKYLTIRMNQFFVCQELMRVTKALWPLISDQPPILGRTRASSMAANILNFLSSILKYPDLAGRFELNRKQLKR